MANYDLAVKVLQTRADKLAHEIAQDDAGLKGVIEALNLKKDDLSSLRRAIGRLEGELSKHTWADSARLCCDGGCHSCMDNGSCCEEGKDNGKY